MTSPSPSPSSSSASGSPSSGHTKSTIGGGRPSGLDPLELALLGAVRVEIADARATANDARRLTERSVIFWTVGRSGALLGFDRSGNVRYRFAGDGRAAFTPEGGYVRFLLALLRQPRRVKPKRHAS